jgi:hypothetical protein
MPSLNIPYSGIGPDFSVLYQEMKFDRRVDGAYFQCLDKKTTHTQISNSRRIFRSAAPPEDPHTLRGLDSLAVPSRMKNLLFQDALVRACDFRSRGLGKAG